MKYFYGITLTLLFVACTPTSMDDETLTEETIELQNLEDALAEDKTESATLKDTDQDGINDQADVDVDGDGVADNGTDTDGDGINDAADVDIDNDGVDDNGSDIDEDGINDDHDDDIDGDGISNDEDEYTSLSDSSISGAAQQKITAYIEANYAGQTIIEVEIENQQIEIELSGHTSLYFDANGDYLALDVDADDHDDNDDDDNHDDGEHYEDENHEGNEDENEYTSLASSNLSAEVQQNISAYLQVHYSNQTVVEVEVENQKIEIELNNGIELIFDLAGNFLRIDD